MYGIAAILHETSPKTAQPMGGVAGGRKRLQHEMAETAELAANCGP